MAAAHALAAAHRPSAGGDRLPAGSTRWSSDSPACWSSSAADPDVGDLDRYAAVAGRGWPRRRRRSAPRRPAAGVTHVLPVVFDGADLDDVAATVGLTTRPGRRPVVGGRARRGLRGLRPRLPLPHRTPARARRPPPSGHPPDVGPGRVGGGGRRIRRGLSACRPPAAGTCSAGPTESLFDPDRPPHSRVAPGRPGPLRRRRRGRRPRRAGAGRARPAAPGGRRRARASRCSSPGLLDLVQDGGRTRCRPRSGCPGPGRPTPGPWRWSTCCSATIRPRPRSSARPSGPTLRVVGDGHLAVVGRRTGVRRRHGRRPAGARRRRHSRGRRSGGLRRDGCAAACGPTWASPAASPPRGCSAPAPPTSCRVSGPAPLRAGDRLARGRPGRVRGRLDGPRTATAGGPVVLRVLPGPHVIGDDGHRRAVRPADVDRWSVGPDVDRIGVRLAALDGDGRRPGRRGPRPR